MSKILILTLLILIISTTSTPKKNSYNFLIISDIHHKIENVYRILERVQSEKYDYVLCPGDLVTIPEGLNDNQTFIDEYTPILKKILIELERVAPVLWIPGNHEPGTVFKEGSEKLTKDSINIHKNYVKIDEKLSITGLGGSIPILDGGKYYKGFVPFNNLDYRKYILSGYPYCVNKDYDDCDKEYDKDLEATINKAKSEEKDTQIIMMTHLGPSYTTTSFNVEEGAIMYLGSRLLGKRIEDDNSLLINVHGHGHFGKGFANLPGKKYVANPGASKESFYGTLKVNFEEGKWYVESVGFRNLE